MCKQLCVVAAVLVGSWVTVGSQQAAPQGSGAPAGQAATAPASTTNLGTDANGNPLRRALKTGHVSNYDEAKVGRTRCRIRSCSPNGQPVRDAKTWQSSVGPRSCGCTRPRSTAACRRTTPTRDVAGRRDGSERARRRGGDEADRRDDRRAAPDAPQINADALHAGERRRGRVPVILLVNFGGGPPPPRRTRQARRRLPADPPVAAEILARGWGYATVGYQDIQPDRADAWTQGVIGRDARAGAGAARARRVGHDQRLVVGRQPHHRLPRDRSRR